MCESSLNTLVNLRGSLSFAAERGTAGEQRFTNGKDGGSIEVMRFPRYLAVLIVRCTLYVCVRVCVCFAMFLLR